MSRLFIISVLLFATVVFPLFAFAADPIVVAATHDKKSIVNFSEFIVSGKSYFAVSVDQVPACLEAGGSMGTYETRADGTQVHVYTDYCYFGSVQSIWTTHSCSKFASPSAAASFAGDVGAKCFDVYSCPPADYPYHTVRTDDKGQQPVEDGIYCKKPDCSGLAGITDYSTYIPMGFNGTDTFGCVNSCQVKVMGISQGERMSV